MRDLSEDYQFKMWVCDGDYEGSVTVDVYFNGHLKINENLNDYPSDPSNFW